MAYASLMTISAGKYKYTEITDGRTLEERHRIRQRQDYIVAKKSDDEDFEG